MGGRWEGGDVDGEVEGEEEEGGVRREGRFPREEGSPERSRGEEGQGE